MNREEFLKTLRLYSLLNLNSYNQEYRDENLFKLMDEMLEFYAEYKAKGIQVDVDFSNLMACEALERLCFDCLENMPAIIKMQDENGDTIVHKAARVPMIDYCLAVYGRQPEVNEIKNNECQTYLDIVGRSTLKHFCRKALTLSGGSSGELKEIYNDLCDEDEAK